MITYLLITAFVSIVVGIVAHATKRAPVAFENDAGFQLERRLALMRLENQSVLEGPEYAGPRRRASDPGSGPGGPA